MHDPLVEIFAKIGSQKPIFDLVDSFYDLVEKDPILRPMYPEDLSNSKEQLALFLLQRFGGPDTYSQVKGHPRMRARHMPFKIGQKERDAWLVNMNQALTQIPEFSSCLDLLSNYFSDFSSFLINHAE